MDIKDFILVGGGILIVLVIAHGFWIAYRAKREPYRLDIVPDLIPDDIDDMERLRGELPNGGARVIRRIDKGLIPEQDSLDLEIPAEPTPTLMDVDEPVTHPARKPLRKPRIFQAPPRRLEPTEELTQEKVGQEKVGREKVRQERVAQKQSAQKTVTPEESSSEIQVDLPLAEQGSVEPSISPMDPDAPASIRVADVQLVTERRVAQDLPIRAVQTPNRSAGNHPTTTVKAEPAKGEVEESPALDRAVEELLIINVVAAKGHRFGGEDMVRALRGQGLTYGEMNIFHRKDPLTKVKQFSIANLIEPGSFDLSELDGMSSPGMSFFMQLPGPEDATDAFDDMISTAQHIAVELGGELRDEQMSVMTGQNREHMRQRIADYARRRLSIRA